MTGHHRRRVPDSWSPIPQTRMLVSRLFSFRKYKETLTKRGKGHSRARRCSLVAVHARMAALSSPFDEEYRDQVRAYHGTPACEEVCRKRQAATMRPDSPT